MNDALVTQIDRMRYTKNTASSRLALLAIVFDILFFISLYKSDVGTYYYTILIGASIIYNLVFLLTTFLCSEGVKNYRASYSWVMISLGIVQFVRIFILPMRAHDATVKLSGADTVVMQTPQFIRVIVYLAGSAVCLLIAAVINQRKCRALEAHAKTLNAKEAA